MGWQSIVDIAADAHKRKEFFVMSKLNLSALTRGVLSYAAEQLGAFLRKVTSKEIGSHTPTGFAALDELIGGGLRRGVYILMAVPGAGKTTLAMQIMDNIAIGGRDVIFFSAEMRVDDLMAKLLSRHSLKTSHPMDSNEILALGNRPDAVSIAEELNAIYHPYAEHTIIVPRDQIDSLNAMERMLQEYQEATGQTPVVIIDYLQQLAAKVPAGTDKQAVDAVLTEIGDLSVKMDLPIILVSSVSRAAYGKALSMSACKDSGNIEYAADVIMGLDCIDPEQASKDCDEYPDRPHKVRLTLPKNRFGRRGASVDLTFDAKYNNFTEVRKRNTRGSKPTNGTY